jgi:ribose transport system ATP-binding protein/rhamnose transport system ATP-binding protein
MTTSDLEDIIGLGDIVVTMYRGKQVGRYSRGEITMRRLISDITHPTGVTAA